MARGRFPVLQRQRIELSIEHMALRWAWHNAMNAAALACELLRWGTPPPDTDPPEVTEARVYIERVVDCIEAFVEGRVPDPPADFGEPHEHVLTRLYWYAAHLGNKTVEACNHAADTLKVIHVKDVAGDRVAHLRQHWRGLGEAAKCATEFIRKFATNNPVIGAADGSASGTLNRIGGLLQYAGKPSDEIIGHMFYWRVKDALKGKTLPADGDADLRAAFEAAWTAGEYEFAYSLLDDLDTIAVP